MKCPNCDRYYHRNTWKCSDCGSVIEGGVVFVTGISGSGSAGKLKAVVNRAQKHNHSVRCHDVGDLMHEFARRDDPGIKWERILDSDSTSLRYLRRIAFERIRSEVLGNPKELHLINHHLSFRWHAYLTKGFEPFILDDFIPKIRCFINLIEDLPKIQERLAKTQ